MSVVSQGFFGADRRRWGSTFVAPLVVVFLLLVGPGVARASGTSPTDLAQKLVTDTTNLAPGNAPTAQALAIQRAVNTGQTATACADITTFLGLVNAQTGTQSGKKLTAASATLTTDAKNIASALGCSGAPPPAPPSLANIESSALTYYAGTSPAPVTSTLTVTSSTTHLVGATVSISSGLVPSDDSLGFSTQNGITGNYDSSSGVLTLAGTATVANYQAALRSVTYRDSNAGTPGGTRTVSYQVDDGLSSGNLSNVASRTISVLTNTGPTAGPVSASTDKNTATDISVLGSASDVDGDSLSVTAIDTTGTKGSVSINPDGTVHYDPNGQFANLLFGQSATDTFGYTVSDPFGHTANGTVTVTITGTGLQSGLDCGSFGGQYTFHPSGSFLWQCVDYTDSSSTGPNSTTLSTDCTNEQLAIDGQGSHAPLSVVPDTRLPPGYFIAGCPN